MFCLFWYKQLVKMNEYRKKLTIHRVSNSTDYNIYFVYYIIIFVLSQEEIRFLNSNPNSRPTYDNMVLMNIVNLRIITNTTYCVTSNLKSRFCPQLKNKFYRCICRQYHSSIVTRVSHKWLSYCTSATKYRINAG